jgi:hypothetical protein
MPQYKIGDIWARYGLDGEVILVPTNSTLNRNRHLVMGAGAALHASWEEPDLPERFGSLIAKYDYHILGQMDWDIWAFQTKRNWKDDSDLDLITESVNALALIALSYPEATFNLCWPGIGFGKLTKATTKPILDNLPDNVIVWSFD